MRQLTSIPEKLFVTHGKEIEEVFRQAVRAALLRHKKLGQSVAVWRDGKVVVLSAEEIPVDDEPDAAPRPAENGAG